MSSKREELIKMNLPKGKIVEIEDVIEGDTISLNKEEGSAKSELHSINKSIKSLLKNHDVSLGSELINLYNEKTRVEKKLETIASIKKEYLSV